MFVGVFQTRHLMVLLLSTVAISFLLLCGAYMRSLNTPPPDFPLYTSITVTEGMSHREITQILAEKNLVRSIWYTEFVFRFIYSDVFVQTGTYDFPELLSTQGVVASLIDGRNKAPLLQVTFPEGFSVRDFDKYAQQLDPLERVSLTALEGFLFPDTYFITPSTTQTELVEEMQRNYSEKIAPYQEQIRVSGLTEREVIILASIIEREAKDRESKHLVAGILRNRLRDNMPLQVDATFNYILGKTSEELTVTDLAMESPYNTYRNRGLPPTPIANPGIDAIDAVLNPTPSSYVYYLTAPDGTFHYAETFEAHVANKKQYLQ